MSKAPWPMWNKNGDAAVHALSAQLDKWEPDSFRLSSQDIEQAMSKVFERDLKGIQFAQAQVRRFAETQKTVPDEHRRETLPGVGLGHKTSRSTTSVATCRKAAIR